MKDFIKTTNKRSVCKIIGLFLILTIIFCVLSAESCIDETDRYSVSTENTDNTEFAFEAMLFDNQGDNFVTFIGNSFNISPNKVKQWDYNTDGSWTSWYETGSVMTIEIDGHAVETCGSTALFKDSRLEIKPLTVNIGTLDNFDKSGYSIYTQDSSFKNYLGLTRWWFDTHEKGQGGAKLVLIQSQDGYNIGTIEGNDVYWKVAEKLPKTTVIKIDKKSLYIHRCNFTIIDTALFNNVVMPTEEATKTK